MGSSQLFFARIAISELILYKNKQGATVKIYFKFSGTIHTNIYSGLIMAVVGMVEVVTVVVVVVLVVIVVIVVVVLVVVIVAMVVVVLEVVVVIVKRYRLL